MGTISGKYLEVWVGGTPVEGAYAWHAEESADELDATVGEDGGYDRPADGVKSMTVTLRGFFDLEDGVYADVRRGSLLTDFQLYRNIEDAAPAFEIPEAVVLQSTMGGEVRGKIEWTARVRTRGEYTYNDPGS